MNAIADLSKHKTDEGPRVYTNQTARIAGTLGGW